MSNKIGVAIVGGTGFGAGELLRLLCYHPNTEVCSVVSGSKSEQSIASAHPHVSGQYALDFDSEINIEKLNLYKERVIFLAIPHGKSGKVALELLDNKALSGAKIIDLSGDFRLQDENEHRNNYSEMPFAQKTRGEFVYGLPELFKAELKKASLVSNPGCLATAAALACLPICTMQTNGSIVIDAKTGSSGSGRHLRETTHHPWRHGNYFAYKPLAHQHEPEVRQTLEFAGAKNLQTSFVAQSIPAVRGIYVTVHAELTKALDPGELNTTYKAYFKDSPFVRISDAPPQMKNVVGTNVCEIFATSRDKQVVVMAAIDNLVKGMAGQAIQNMNIIFGLEETTGLLQPALGPM